MSSTKLIYNPLKGWLSTLSNSKSGSHNTIEVYAGSFNKFLEFIQTTATGILAEYDKIQNLRQEKKFKQKYSRLLMAWIEALKEQGYAPNSIRTKQTAVKSFFKYNDLPLAYVPDPKDEVKFHNRDVSKEELALIISAARPREKAYYLIMAQSGIRPYSLSKLQLKDVELDRLETLKPPVKLEVLKEKSKGKFHGYFTFMAREAVQALKAYLATRPNLNPDSYLFVQHRRGKEETPLSANTVSALFRYTVRKLRKSGKLDFKIEAGKPGEVRLYNLRKFFKKFAYQAGLEFVEFWFGHGLGVNKHYLTKDVEHHRKLYREKVSPFLQIEPTPPTETEETINKMRKENQTLTDEVSELKLQLKITNLAMEKFTKETAEKLKKFESIINKYEKKEIQEQDRELMTECDEDPDSFETEPSSTKGEPHHKKTHTRSKNQA